MGQSSNKARRQHRDKGRGGEDDDASIPNDDDDDDDDDVGRLRKSSPHKSPARRHAQRRRNLKRVDTSSDEEPNGGDNEDNEEDDDDDSEDRQSSDEASEPEEPLKVQRILACRTETKKRWKEICRNINTSEIEYGSRWFQEPPEDENEDDYEERFLIKWSDLSYLHASWETRDDLIEQIEGAKVYLTTFFRKSQNGLLFSADERCDGDYFDPAFTEIDRILEVDVPKGYRAPGMDVNLEDTFTSSSFGMIMDKADPDFEEGTGRQFLVKWNNTSYSESSYEFERDLILRDIEYKDKVKDFLQRGAKLSKKKRESFLKQGQNELSRLVKIFGDNSNLSEGNINKAVEKYKRELDSYHFKNGGKLRDYQIEGVAWMVSNYVNGRSSILADEMGLGKTLQTVVFIDILLKNLKRGGPALVIVPLSTITHWYREFATWTNLNAVLYHGSSEDRDLIRRYEMVFEPDRPQQVLSFNQLFLKKCCPKKVGRLDSPWMIDVLITTPEMLIADDYIELSAIRWEILVVDEAHRLKNYNSKLAVSLRDQRFTFEHKLLLTGTPIQNSVDEFWSILNLVDAEQFADKDEFLKKYGDMKSKENVDQLHEEIRPYILRRLKEDVEKSVPQKSETLIEVELTVHQKKWYRALYEKNIGFLRRNKKKALDGPALTNLAMELRKCCNHLFLVNGAEEEFRREHTASGTTLSEGDFLSKASGKLVLLDKLLPRLKEEGHRVLIFSQFKIMLDILEDYLHARSMKFERIDGSITGRKRQQAIDRFQSSVSNGKELPFIMMLSTRAGGVGINLTAADTCIIFDSDFNPQNDLQAQARCHRIGQTKEVKVYRLLTRKTYEMQMFHMSSLKMGLDQVVLKGFESGGNEACLSKDEVEKLLRHGAYDIFNEDKNGRGDAESNDFVQQDIDSILQRRSRVVNYDNTGSGSNAAGGTFSKARFTSGTKGAATTENGEVQEDVDIEDPEFWTKMLGESSAIDDTALLDSKTRHRPRANYSEQEYQKSLEAHFRLVDEDAMRSDSENSDFAEDNRERMRWGGKLGTEWSRDDAESVLKALTTYGYGIIPWHDFVRKLQLSKTYSDLEIKRMCWAMVLLALVEGTTEEVELINKKEARIAKKLLDKSVEKASNDGGVLASVVSMKDDVVTEEPRVASKIEAFGRLWKPVSTWCSSALSDAVEYAKTQKPRDNETLQLLNNNDSKQLSADDINRRFATSIWPSLKSRGWKAVLKSEGEATAKAVYQYETKVFTSIDDVLSAAKVFHGELSSIVDTLIEAVESNRRKLLQSDDDERELHLALTGETLSLQSIISFLDRYAPLQLLHDRKSSKKIRLSKRLLSICTLMHNAAEIISQAGIQLGGSLEVEQLALKFSSIEKRNALPHPLWTSQHDAVLVYAISRHGWIDQDSSCRAITEDSSIKWGYPFDLSDSGKETPTTSKTPELVAAAHRVVNFLNSHHNSLGDLKGFNLSRIVRAYGIVKADAGNMPSSVNWTIDESLLKPSEAVDQGLAELPTKKDLVKRAKMLLGRGQTVDKVSVVIHEVKQLSTKDSYGYTMVDQTDPTCLFLVEILRGIVKTSVVSKRLQILCSAAVAEAKKLAEACKEQGSSAKSDFARIVEQLEQVKFHIFKFTTQSKNLVRVMLADDPVKPKSGEESLFPKPIPAPLNIRTSSMQASKSKNMASRLVQRAARPSGDACIELARQRMKEIFGDVCKLSTLNDDSALLQLTEIETIILSALCKFGMPLWTATFKDMQIKADQEMAKSVRFSWSDLGRQVLKFAGEELSKAKKRMLDTNEVHSRNSEDSKFDQSRSVLILLDMEKDISRKEEVVRQASSYALESENLAKKVTMLVAKLRDHSGPSTVTAFTMRALSGLGTKVLLWLDQETGRWAESLDLMDHRKHPLAFTAIDFLDDVPVEDRSKIQISAILDKKGCRAILAQMAMITRLRAIAAILSKNELHSRIERSVMSLLESQDKWENEPKGWVKMNVSDQTISCEHDKKLVYCLIEHGLTDELLDCFTSAEQNQCIEVRRGCLVYFEFYICYPIS